MKVEDRSVRGRQRRRLVVTLGPKSLGLASELHRSGADTLRLNASHLPAKALEAAIVRARRAAPAARILVDLQGAKMRLGRFSPRRVARDDRVALVLAQESHGDALPLPHAELFEVLQPGDTLSLDDGRHHALVERCGGQRLTMRMLTAGTLLARKGVNRADHPVTLEGLTERDRNAISVARSAGCGDFAVSFVSDGRECDWVRQLAPEAHVTAKLERSDALEHLEAIAARADELWVCRGDLGAQLGLLALGRAVAQVAPQSLPVPVLMAGQVLEHMRHGTQPTRSEICHLSDLLARGYAGVVLSDETALGDSPELATEWAAALLGLRAAAPD